MDPSPKIVLLGGGTGSYELLLGLKHVAKHLTAVVNMCDDGGSTGRLRADYGVMPPGDVRQCLAALAGDEELARIFSYRFSDGYLAGQPVGNMWLSAAELVEGDFGAAVDQVARMLRCVGEVLPVTATKHGLAMRDGEQIIRGQERVRLHTVKNRGATRIWLEPEAAITPAVGRSIAEADLVIIAPGGLNWTLLPICAVEGVREALECTAGHVVCVTNLMNRPEQHRGWHVVDYIHEFRKYLGDDVIDTVLYNDGQISPVMLEGYAAAHEEPVDISDDRFSEVDVRFVAADLVAPAPKAQDSADQAVPRARIRHDSTKTAEALMRIFKTTSKRKY